MAIIEQAEAAPDVQPEVSVAAPAAAPEVAQPKTPATPTPHTSGGVPALPLALTTANTAVAGASAAALTLGPLAAVAAVLLPAAGAVVATRVSRRTPKGGPAARRAAASQQAAASRIAKQLNLAGASGRGASKGRTASSFGSTGLSKAGKGKPSKPAASVAAAAKGAARSAKGAAGAAKGTAGAVKAVRAAQKAAAPTRQAQRQQQKTDRRQVADARRDAKAQAQQHKAKASGLKGIAARTLAKPAKAAKAARAKAREKARESRDQRTEAKVSKARKEVRKAPIRAAARKALRRSAARLHAKHVAAVAAATPLGILGMLTTPIGRYLGWKWLMNPGQRLYRALMGKARAERKARDAEIREGLAQEEQAVDATAAADAKTDDDQTPENGIADTVSRAPKSHNSQFHNAQGEQDMSSGFNFDEVASEMYQAAMSFEPDGMMQVLKACESMPEALTSIANTFRVLAERCDGEFPLEPAVGEAMNEVFLLLTQAASASEEVSKVFRNNHESDIRRLEERRNGEEKWDTTNNDD